MHIWKYGSYSCCLYETTMSNFVSTFHKRTTKKESIKKITKTISIQPNRGMDISIIPFSFILFILNISHTHIHSLQFFGFFNFFRFFSKNLEENHSFFASHNFEWNVYFSFHVSRFISASARVCVYFGFYLHFPFDFQQLPPVSLLFPDRMP